jgi:hypothetical protein
MDLVILFDRFANESMDAALQAIEWQQREMFLRFALMCGTAAQQHRVDRGPRELQHATVG